ncbi:hypothetical protein N656DRAFT_398243 [Canariomyces notabilis]|uniref:Uncharacterized protein n=1 Tax=Canariomyces notabilis TaxID=2074819 RepID=A0AAN6TJW7_9PEZI|nr:hypothetical protein N656DRAFT_398243 [Canariomyces arenarius]
MTLLFVIGLKRGEVNFDSLSPLSVSVNRRLTWAFIAFMFSECSFGLFLGGFQLLASLSICLLSSPIHDRWVHLSILYTPFTSLKRRYCYFSFGRLLAWQHDGRRHTAEPLARIPVRWMYGWPRWTGVVCFGIRKS